jgi:hypothetical protein
MHKLYLLTPFLLAGSLFAADPFAATWKLDLAKSKFEGPMKPPKELTIVIQEQGDQGFDTVTSVPADGSAISYKGTFPKYRRRSENCGRRRRIPSGHLRRACQEEGGFSHEGLDDHPAVSHDVA